MSAFQCVHPGRSRCPRLPAARLPVARLAEPGLDASESQEPGSASRATQVPAGLENLRTIAVSQLMIEAGADDIDGTVVWYDITKAVGEGTHQETTELDLRRAISGGSAWRVET